MNNILPKVSIIIPNYNYAIYLEQRILSILNQTYQDFELIILDDASQDHSAEIINKYRTNPHVTQVVINSQNSGSPFKQWMKGIQLAKGEWIWVAEADDLCEQTFLEKCMHFISQNNNVAICNTGCVHINTENKVLNHKVFQWSKQELASKATLFNGKEFAEHVLYWKNDIPNASGVLFNKQCALNITDKTWMSMRYCGDWLFWFHLSLQGDVIQIYETLNYFRQHDSQTAKGRYTGQNIIETFIVASHIEKIIPTISFYKRRQKHGRDARLIRHIKNIVLKQQIKKEYKQLFHSSVFRDYLYFKIHRHLRFIPFILTEEKDRNKALKKSKTFF